MQRTTSTPYYYLFSLTAKEKIEDKNATNVQPSSKHMAYCGNKVQNHVFQGNLPSDNVFESNRTVNVMGKLT